MSPSSFDSSLTIVGTPKNPPGYLTIIKIYRISSAIQLVFYTNAESISIFGSVVPSPASSPTTDCVIMMMEGR